MIASGVLDWMIKSTADDTNHEVRRICTPERWLPQTGFYTTLAGCRDVSMAAAAAAANMASAHKQSHTQNMLQHA